MTDHERYMEALLALADYAYYFAKEDWGREDGACYSTAVVLCSRGKATRDEAREVMLALGTIPDAVEKALKEVYGK